MCMVCSNTTQLYNSQKKNDDKLSDVPSKSHHECDTNQIQKQMTTCFRKKEKETFP